MITTATIYKKMIDIHLKGLQAIASSVWGWSIFALSTLGAFFGPEKYSFIVVLVMIMLDAVFGAWVSLASGKFLLSKLGRVTILKITSYGAALVTVYMVEKLAHDTGFIGVKVAAGWAVACEFWSMSASILILWPEAYFFKIMRRHLKGEIASKLGAEIDDILPEEVKK